MGCRTTAGNTREGTRHALLQSSWTITLRLSIIYRSVPHQPAELIKGLGFPLSYPYSNRYRLQ